MCGIVGYVGNAWRHAAPHRRAEAARVPRLRLGRRRDHERQGRRDAEGGGQDLAARERRVRASPVHGTLGIAHTRWATHGAPNECNAHPHIDCKGTIAVVHNGIIENCDRAARRCSRSAATSSRPRPTPKSSRTSSRKRSTATSRTRSSRRSAQVEGTYGIAVISSEDPNKIVAARKGSPLLIGLGEGEYFVASDVVGDSRAHAPGRLPGRRRDGGADARRLSRSSTSTRREQHEEGQQDRLGPRPDRARRLRPLHAQGDLRAAADDREHDARPPARATRARRSSAV